MAKENPTAPSVYAVTLTVSAITIALIPVTHPHSFRPDPKVLAKIEARMQDGKLAMVDNREIETATWEWQHQGEEVEESVNTYSPSTDQPAGSPQEVDE